MSPDDESPILGPDGQPLPAAASESASESAAESAGEAGPAAEPAEGERQLPEPTLLGHVFHLASQVGMALGEAENPLSGRRETDLPTARFLIDTIAMLEEKTRGNRSPEEDEYLGGVLSNLRMAYVAKTK